MTVADPVELARADEQLRQERETFDQRKEDGRRWFIVRLWMCYTSILVIVSIVVVCSYILLNYEKFPTNVIGLAGAALLVDILGMMFAVWKIVLNPNSVATLEPVTRAAGQSRVGADGDNAPNVNASPSTSHVPTPHIEAPGENQRFREINARVIAAEELKLRQIVTRTDYKFVFNPETGRSKRLTFKENGEIGEGRNDNEYKWRIKDGRLEVIHKEGHIYSRFLLVPGSRNLHHTNDTDLPSIKGQFLEATGWR